MYETRINRTQDFIMNAKKFHLIYMCFMHLLQAQNIHV